MKHAREDYDRFQDPEGIIPDKEPVFLLRGQDLAGPHTLRAYATRASELGASQKLVTAAFQHATAMEEWQKKHGGKVPDMPSPTEGDETEKEKD